MNIKNTYWKCVVYEMDVIYYQREELHQTVINYVKTSNIIFSDKNMGLHSM